MALGQSSVRAAIPGAVVDGNREMRRLRTESIGGGDAAANARAARRRLRLGGLVWWADRGGTWTWSGIPLLGAYGGSALIERWKARVAQYRRKQETPTQRQLYRLSSFGREGIGLAADGGRLRTTVLSISNLRTDYVSPFRRSHHRV